MRQVEIVQEARNQRPWVAVDVESRKPLLRMQRLEPLLTISRSLGWEVVTGSDPIPTEVSPPVRKGNPLNWGVTTSGKLAGEGG